MNVSAIIVTRGNVDLKPVLDSLPAEWEKIIWDNGAHKVHVSSPHWHPFYDQPDLSVYGRYASIKYASYEMIYVQDDDVVVGDPQAIVDSWATEFTRINDTGEAPVGAHLVANMPQEFRHEGYTDSCLVGFGACFHRDLPARTFARFLSAQAISPESREWFNRTCDVVFTTLTPRVLVDVPKTDREFASDPDRMWKQPEHYGERVRMLELARRVRDGK